MSQRTFEIVTHTHYKAANEHVLVNKFTRISWSRPIKKLYGPSEALLKRNLKHKTLSGRLQTNE